LRLRNIGGMVIVDFIDMDSRKDQQQVLEVFHRNLEDDRAKPQVGQLSDLGLVELTRRRQGQSLRELFTLPCQSCLSLGVVPALEIGSGENKRVITFKSNEDFLGKGRGLVGGRQKMTVLRAATASNGRIMPTIDIQSGSQSSEEDNMAALPQHILEQVPDDLLQADSLSGSRRSTFMREEEEEDAEAEAHMSEPLESADELTSNKAMAEEFQLEETREQTEIDPVTGVYRLKPDQTAESDESVHSQHTGLDPSAAVNEPIKDQTTNNSATAGKGQRLPAALDDWFKKFR
jgi:hypothetical protein